MSQAADGFRESGETAAPDQMFEGLADEEDNFASFPATESQFFLSVPQLVKIAAYKHDKLRAYVVDQLRFMGEQLTNEAIHSMNFLYDDTHLRLNEFEQILRAQQPPEDRCERCPLPQQQHAQGQTAYADAATECCWSTADSSFQTMFNQFLNWQSLLSRSLADEIESHFKRIRLELKILFINKYAEINRRAGNLQKSIRIMGSAINRRCSSCAKKANAGEDEKRRRVPEAADADPHAAAATAAAVAPQPREVNSAAEAAVSVLAARCAEDAAAAGDKATDVVGAPSLSRRRRGRGGRNRNVVDIPATNIGPVLWKKIKRERTAREASTRKGATSSGTLSLREWEAVRSRADEVWQSIEIASVAYEDDERLSGCAKTLIRLGFAVCDKRLFYEYALRCAAQLRNPANVDELAILVASAADGSGGGGNVPPDEPHPLSAASELLADGVAGPREKKFLARVAEMDHKTVAAWAPAYACLLLKLADAANPALVCGQLERLNAEVAAAYHLPADALPEIPVSAGFVDHLRRHYVGCAVVDVPTRNAVYKGLVERYECATTPARSRKLLNFVLLNGIRYRGMPLLTLVDECVRLYGVRLEELIEHTTSAHTRNSWAVYRSFFEKVVMAGRAGQRCKKWKYAACFRPRLYAELGFTRTNYRLCLLLSVLCDVRRLQNGGESANKLRLYHKFLKKAAAHEAFDDECQSSASQTPEPADAAWKVEAAKTLLKLINASFAPKN